MTEIQLPCCENPVQLETLETTIHCDHCGIDLDLADDAAPEAALAA